MKERWKVFWIVCATLASMGLVFCVAGAAAGGATLKEVRAVFWNKESAQGKSSGEPESDTSKQPDANSGLQAEQKDDGQNQTNQEQAQQEQQEQTQPAVTDTGDNVREYTGIRELDLEVTYMKVEIKQGTANVIRTEVSGIDDRWKDAVKFYTEDSELSIQMSDQKSWKDFYADASSRPLLTITLPKGTKLDKIDASIGAGSLEADALYAGTLDLEVGAGSADITSFQADEMSLEVGAGEADIAGDVSRKADIDCGLGEVYYHASGKEEDYHFSLESGMADVVIGGKTYNGVLNDISQISGGAKEMNIDCGIGRVEVTFDR